MTARNPHTCRQPAASSHTRKLTTGLGWFSIGLGLSELIAPRTLSKVIGIRSTPKNRAVLRLYALRELAAGIGILAQPRPAGWLWARVAGDAVDLASLFAALGGKRNSPGKVGFAIVSVAGVTAADVHCAGQVSGRTDTESSTSSNLVRTIIVDRPIEEAYNFWHDFENLPRVMTYLESVRHMGDSKTHWIANGPAGATIEWDAETTTDEPNRMIAWRTLDGSPVQHSGSIQFQPSPGNRGTLVRVEIDYSRTSGAPSLGKLLRMDIGRRIRQDLRNFKQVLEVGEVTQSDASVHEGTHAAQPEPVYQH